MHLIHNHGNYIVDPGKSWNSVFEFLWEPCACFPRDFNSSVVFTSDHQG